MFSKFKWFISYYKKKYILAIIFLLLSDIVGLFPPYITGKLTDLIFTNSVSLNRFFFIIGITFVIIIIKYFLAMGWSYFTFRGADEIEYKSRENLMNKFLRQSLKFFEKNSTGSLMGKATNDVTSLTDLAGFGLLNFFDSTVFPICIIIVMMIVVDFKLTLFSIIPLPILAYLCIWIGKKIYTRWTLVQEAFDKLNDSALEDVEGIRIIRVFNLQKLRNLEFEKRGEELCDRNIDVVKYEALMTPIQKIIPAMTFVIALGYGSYLISIGDITVGQLVSFTYYLNMLVWPMYAFGNFINMRQQANASMDRIQEVLDYKEDIVEKDNVIDIGKDPDIEFKGFNFRYPSSKEDILKNINIKLKRGSSLGVLGKTGSGKSTLLKQLLSFYPADTSKIYLNGQSMDNYSIKSIRDNIAYAPQNHMIFSKSIKDNIRLSKPEATDFEIEEAVRLSDLEKDISKFPEGLNTLCGEKGVSLSGGQKQRIAIARALLKNPEILILDDCMSAVDGNTEKNIIENINKKRKNKTTIIASHRISQIKDLDEIIVLKDGKIVERGTDEELMRVGKWYREQYLNQMSRRRFDEKQDTQ
ncbi:MAG: ABC transporter ATP-binding protein [Andreesenia angusta]|nr:ABC transporter ATP-binding protein [Andreesenia angusta]